MPPTSTRKIGQEKNKKGKLSDKTPSFNGRVVQLPPEIIPLPRTVPELVSVKNTGDNAAVAQGRPQKLSKLLLNVTIQRSPGAVHVVISPESTVKDLITAALRQYQKEARRPVLPSSDGCGFQLHYSQFSLECLDMEEKVIALGSRNFFLCPKEPAVVTAKSSVSAITSTAGCSKEADKVNKKGLPWLKLMEFLL